MHAKPHGLLATSSCAWPALPLCQVSSSFSGGGFISRFWVLCPAGDAWVHLLAKLMVSSEEVAATVISRQPSGEAPSGSGGLCVRACRQCSAQGRDVALHMFQ